MEVAKLVLCMRGFKICNVNLNFFKAHHEMSKLNVVLT